jgi:hypothetical protein
LWGPERHTAGRRKDGSKDRKEEGKKERKK